MRYIVKDTGEDFKPFGVWDRDRQTFVSTYADERDARDWAREENRRDGNPPAADSIRYVGHVPPSRVGVVATYAREWISDCDWSEDDIETLLAVMPDDAVIRAAAHHYDGGSAALYRDAMETAAAPDDDSFSARVARARAARQERRRMLASAPDDTPRFVGEPAAAAAEHEAMQAAVTSQDLPPCPACGSADADCEEDCPVRLETRERDAQDRSLAAADDARALESERPNDDTFEDCNPPCEYGRCGICGANPADKTCRLSSRPRARGNPYTVVYAIPGSRDTAEQTVWASTLADAVAIANVQSSDLVPVAVWQRTDTASVKRSLYGATAPAAFDAESLAAAIELVESLQSIGGSLTAAAIRGRCGAILGHLRTFTTPSD